MYKSKEEGYRIQARKDEKLSFFKKLSLLNNREKDRVLYTPLAILSIPAFILLICLISWLLPDMFGKDKPAIAIFIIVGLPLIWAAIKYIVTSVLNWYRYSRDTLRLKVTEEDYEEDDEDYDEDDIMIF